MLISQAGLLLTERRVEIRIVVDLAWATDAGVESLLGPAFALQVVRVEQIASLFGEGQAAFVLAKVDGLDQAFVAEVADGIVVASEVLFGRHSERADGCQRATVLAIQLVHTVPIDNELAFLASRQIEVPHQGVARIVITPVAVLVHARRFVIAIALAVLARIVPSSVRHRPSFAHSSRRLVVREDALAVSARGCSGKRRGAGACRRGDQRVV
jgi:hypothetical protein